MGSGTAMIIVILLLLVAALIWLFLRTQSKPPAPPPRAVDTEVQVTTTVDAAARTPKTPQASPSTRKSVPPKREPPKRRPPPPVGPDRVDLQRKQWQEKLRRDEEDRRVARELADERRATKEREDEEERRKTMQAAEARMQEERDKKARQQEGEVESNKANAALREYLSKAIPPEVKRAMQAYLNGQFVGEDRSPLAYVGYHVGKSSELTQRERHVRLEVCFRVEIPSLLRHAYGS